MYWLSVPGVRKQLTIAPFSGRTGNVPGTPSTIEGLPERVTRSQRRGTVIAVELAMNAPS